MDGFSWVFPTGAPSYGCSELVAEAGVSWKLFQVSGSWAKKAGTTGDRPCISLTVAFPHGWVGVLHRLLMWWLAYPSKRTKRPKLKFKQGFLWPRLGSHTCHFCHILLTKNESQSIPDLRARALQKQEKRHRLLVGEVGHLWWLIARRLNQIVLSKILYRWWCEITITNLCLSLSFFLISHGCCLDQFAVCH